MLRRIVLSANTEWNATQAQLMAVHCTAVMLPVAVKVPVEGS